MYWPKIDWPLMDDISQWLKIQKQLGQKMKEQQQLQAALTAVKTQQWGKIQDKMVLTLAAKWTTILKQEKQYQDMMMFVAVLKYKNVFKEQLEIKLQASVEAKVENELENELTKNQAAQAKLGEELAKLEEEIAGESAKEHAASEQ